MAEETPAIELRNVCKEYASAPKPVQVLVGVDFVLRRGESAAITGPSGSGKSTLLNLMGTLDTPTSGSVLLEGRDVAGLSAIEQAQARNRAIGFVFQLHHLLPQCTLLENVLIPALAHGGADEARPRAIDLLRRAGLEERLDSRPAQLSGGERQRTAVIRALINKPALLLADEPTGSLNEEGAMQLAELILELQRGEGMGVVVVTHSSAIAARFGRVAELRGGRLSDRG